MKVELLPVAPTRFSQVASLITERVAELLYAPVYVTNDRGMVMTSSDAQWVGLPFDRASNIEPLRRYLRVPLRLDAQTGEVIVGEPLNGEAISPRLAQVLVELVINQTTAIDRLPNQHELKNQLIYNLLQGQIADEAAILLQAKQLGVDLVPPRAVILIDAADYVFQTDMFQTGSPSEKYRLGRFSVRDAGQAEAMLEADQRRRAQLVIGSIVSFFHLPSDTICADLGQGEVAVLKASDTKNLESWAVPGSAEAGSSWANLTALRRAADALLLRLRGDTGAAIDVGIGRYHPGLRGLSRSYQDAQAALSLGKRFAGHNQVHCLGRLGVAAFVGVADERTKVELAKYLLSPLDHEPELLTTLDAFFTRDCCPSSTAKRLSIHRNTLSYRFDKIALLTGLDPRRFDDAVQMRLALLLRTLQPQSA
jgi:carbohydrate diacid regulator